MQKGRSPRETYTKIGGRIAALDRRQRDIARTLGVSQQTISRKLLGEVAILVSDLEKLAKHYDVPLTYFFEDGDDLPHLASCWERVRKAPGAVRDLISLACDLSSADVQRLITVAKALVG